MRSVTIWIAAIVAGRADKIMEYNESIGWLLTRDHQAAIGGANPALGVKRRKTSIDHRHRHPTANDILLVQGNRVKRDSRRLDWLQCRLLYGYCGSIKRGIDRLAGV